ncbi:MAG: hypothetical protein GWN58_01170, partial [Anaerolineae bacterium]|nr:hypothetical protein [Anaerolineae bacterium]
AHVGTGFVEHAVEGKGCFPWHIWLEGQETGLVERIQQERIDFLLQFRGELTLEVAQT